MGFSRARRSEPVALVARALAPRAFAARGAGGPWRPWRVWRPSPRCS